MKAFKISSSGLKNILTLKNNIKIFDDEETVPTTKELEEYDLFYFDFGKIHVQMPVYLAEFISPRVSHLHQTDPTINSISIDIDNTKTDQMKQIAEKLVEISIGTEIEISEKDVQIFLILSAYLENSELYNAIIQDTENDDDEKTIDFYIESLKYLDKIKGNNLILNEPKEMIEFISSHFYLIDNKKLFEMPIETVYLILANDHLKLKNEDSLFDFINEYLENKKESEIESKRKEKFRCLLYEQVEMRNLSENKMRDLIENIDPNEISHQMWMQLKQCFYYEYQINKKENETRYQKSSESISPSHNTIDISFDNNPNHRFNGIISYLLNKNPDDDEVIAVAASSVFNSRIPKNAIDFNDDSILFNSLNQPNSWIKIDFKQRKVKLTNYSIKSNHWGDEGHYHLQSWRIEGSNDDLNWETIDTRTNDKSIDGLLKMNTFTIENNTSEHDVEYYRYIRLRQCGENTRGNDQLIISSLEFFGSILEPLNFSNL